MNAFSTLYRRLDATKRTNEKIDAMVEYFRNAPPPDAAWAAFFLSGRRLKRIMTIRNLGRWATEVVELPDWLFNECYEAVGDLAETIALILPTGAAPREETLSSLVEKWILPLREQDEDRQRASLLQLWTSFDRHNRFVLNKLITGGLRVGVSKILLVRALERATGVPRATLMHRLMGPWEPSGAFYRRLISPDDSSTAISQPYPFCLAHPISEDPSYLTVEDFQVEWKWDGIRAQVIHREEQVFVWSRGEELITDGFPEVRDSARMLPSGTVLDGEIVAWKDDTVLPFSELQKRIGRKNLTASTMKRVPVRFLAFDLLEEQGHDVRNEPLSVRRGRLDAMLASKPSPPSIGAAPIVSGADWSELDRVRATSRQRGVEGLMLKRLGTPYMGGRVRDVWWKWKVDPLTVDAVLIYAQRGHGKRAGIYSDYTFAVWKNDELVPFAKAYSGLDDDELRQVDRFVRSNILERFGPVRRVTPTLVFEIGFESIRRSSRHKSGVAVRFPRMLRWRRDKDPTDADSLEALLQMLPDHER